MALAGRSGCSGTISCEPGGQVALARRSATICAVNGMPVSTSTSMLRPRRARRTSSIASGVYCGIAANHNAVSQKKRAPTGCDFCRGSSWFSHERWARWRPPSVNLACLPWQSKVAATMLGWRRGENFPALPVAGDAKPCIALISRLRTYAVPFSFPPREPLCQCRT
jgi:hypothetical protein